MCYRVMATVIAITFTWRDCDSTGAVNAFRHLVVLLTRLWPGYFADIGSKSFNANSSRLSALVAKSFKASHRQL